MVIGVLAVRGAAALGWLFAGRAVRPLRQAHRGDTRALGKGEGAWRPCVESREAEDLYDAMSEMLQRLVAAQASMRDSLQAAQDFAASAAHELRTPLTAMRADLDTLRVHDLAPQACGSGG